VVSGEQAGGSVLDRMGDTASEVISSMHELASLGEEITGLMKTVAETIKEMSVFLSGIEEVGAEIELISLNASVKAAHTGEDGKALGVLAQSIQRLSTDAMDQTRKVSQVLTSITECSERLEERSSDYVNTGELERLVERQLAATDSLKDLNGRVEKLSRSVQEESRELGKDIAAVAGGTNIHEQVGGELREISSRVARIIADTLEAVPEMDEAARSERLKELLGRYTMEAERMVHLAESSRGVDLTAASAETEIEMFADDGGDDVELFDDAQEDEGPSGDVDVFESPEPSSQDAEEHAAGDGEGRGEGAEQEGDQTEDWDNVELF